MQSPDEAERMAGTPLLCSNLAETHGRSDATDGRRPETALRLAGADRRRDIAVLAAAALNGGGSVVSRMGAIRMSDRVEPWPSSPVESCGSERPLTLPHLKRTDCTMAIASNFWYYSTQSSPWRPRLT